MTQRKASAKASWTAIVALAVFSLAAGSAAAQTDLSSYAKAEAASAADGTATRSHGWEVRWGVAGGQTADATLESLVGKAESFAVDLFRWKDEASGENRLLGVGEAHGIFAVSPEAAAAVVLDFPNLKDISPRAKEVRVLDSSDSRWLVYEDIGISFMGISIGYKLDAEFRREILSDGAIGVRCRLVKSHDGKLYGADSSWYFKRIEVGGKAYTYIRTWSTSGLRNPGLGVAGVMKLFTAGELKDQVEAVAKLAAKR
ncbi:MAG: hypothetical protein Q8O15_05955 [Rectinemataceae bacterium]|nr:hypothetical protein [Rectinemataceae bacterium]